MWLSLPLLLSLNASAQDEPAAPETPAPEAPESTEPADEPAPEAPVSTPLSWEATDLPELEPVVYTEVLDDDGNAIPVDELPLTAGPAVAEYVEAPYPPEAEAAELSGKVGLLIELDEYGRVTYVEVIQPAGHGFDEAALEAVSQMRFTPAATEAGPVGVAFEFAYGFTFEPPEPDPEEPPPPLPVNFDGTLTEMGTRIPVAGATVVVDGTDLVATSDPEGTFEIRGVPSGVHTVRILSPSHITVEREIEIVDGEITSADLWIKSTSYRENEAVGVYQKKREEVTRRTLAIEEVKRVPGTFGDPIKVVQTLPGAARSPFGTGLLVIRGSNPEDSGVYVDGIRIPLVYHLTGTTSVLSPDLIESVDYLPGGYGTQYGRSMAGIIDVTTKSEFEENGKLVWGTDILDSQIYYEGRFGDEKKHGISVGARRSYVDVFIPYFTRDVGFTFQPKYWDYSLKLVPGLEGEKKASLFVYGFNDELTVATPDDVAQGSDADTQGAFRTEYSSHRIVGNYQAKLGEMTSLNITPSVGIDYTLTDAFGAIKLNNWNYIGNLRAELPIKPNDVVEIVPGVDILGGPYRFDAEFPFSFDEAVDPLAERNPTKLDGRGFYISPDAFVKAKITPLADPEDLLITLGLRANTAVNRYQGSVTVVDGEPYTWSAGFIDPRIAFRWRPVEAVTLKGATGLYGQPPQPFESVGVGGDVVVGYENAWNSSIGLEHQVTQAVQWDIDLFYRDMNNLIVAGDFSGRGDSTFVNLGEGRAYGGELILRHAPANRFFGWVSYTLSRSERRDAPDEDWYLFDFDQTHIVSAQGGYDLPLDIGISAQVQYVTGNPFTPYNASVYDVDWDDHEGFSIGARNSERLPPFFQTSLRVDKLFTFRKWQLEGYVDFLNAVRGVNPEFTQYNYDYTEYAYVRGLPFIPNVGFEAKFRP